MRLRINQGNPLLSSLGYRLKKMLMPSLKSLFYKYDGKEEEKRQMKKSLKSSDEGAT